MRLIAVGAWDSALLRESFCRTETLSEVEPGEEAENLSNFVPEPPAVKARAIPVDPQKGYAVE
jgi:hypothetical protein